jgi:hypothetical protein
VFHETFYLFAMLSEMMPYTMKVVRKDEWMNWHFCQFHDTKQKVPKLWYFESD